ncbi:hypothetical protein Cus16_1741 [Curtobacterium sp. ER1/6]|nr:hypothetical protein Cus16_1741 [Curtobacterium sp. ER1/6]
MPHLPSARRSCQTEGVTRAGLWTMVLAFAVTRSRGGGRAGVRSTDDGTDREDAR